MKQLAYLPVFLALALALAGCVFAPTLPTIPF